MLLDIIGACTWPAARDLGIPLKHPLSQFFFLGFCSFFKGFQLLGVFCFLGFEKQRNFFDFLCFLEAFLEMWRDPGTPADSYYQVRPECTDVPKTRFKIKVCFLFLFFYNIYNIRIFRYPFGFFRYICIYTHTYIYMAWIKEGGNKW